MAHLQIEKTWTMEKIDRAWWENQQPMANTDLQRAGGKVWEPGPPHGMHLHDDAMEIFYIAQGRCRMRVGKDEQVIERNTLVWAPESAPHALGTEGDEPMFLFLIVTPNVHANRGRGGPFTKEEMSHKLQTYDVEPGVEFPRHPLLKAEVREWEPDTEVLMHQHEDGEQMWYFLKGEGRVGVGLLEGKVWSHRYVWVPQNAPHWLENTGDEPLMALHFRYPNPAANRRERGLT